MLINCTHIGWTSGANSKVFKSLGYSEGSYVQKRVLNMVFWFLVNILYDI